MGIGRPGLLNGVCLFEGSFTLLQNTIIQDGRGGGERGYIEVQTQIPGDSAEKRPSPQDLMDKQMRQHRFCTVLLSGDHVTVPVEIGNRLMDETTEELWHVSAVSYQYPIWNLTCYNVIKGQLP